MAITASEARKNLFPLIEQVNEDRTPVEIDLPSGRCRPHLACGLRLTGGDGAPASSAGEREASTREPAAGALRPAG